MRRLISDICFIAALLLGVVCAAQAQFNSFPPGVFNNKAALNPAVGGGFTGPIDINGAAFALWSTRCSATAYTGNVIDIWDGATGSTTETTVTCSSGGTLNTGSPTAIATTCAVSCRVKTLYDQSGSGKCSGACDMTQPTNANRPTLNTSLLNSKIGMVFTAASSLCLQSIAPATVQAQPLTISYVYNATTSTKMDVFADSSSNFQFYAHESGANTANVYLGGTPISATANDSTTHAAQAFASGASSAIYIDGSNTTGSPGTGAFTVATLIIGGVGNATCASGSQFFNGNIFEVGAWAADKTSNNASMNSNQHTYWNF